MGNDSSRYLWVHGDRLATKSEDKAFPFKAEGKLLISIIEGKKVFLEKA